MDPLLPSTQSTSPSFEDLFSPPSDISFLNRSPIGSIPGVEPGWNYALDQESTATTWRSPLIDSEGPAASPPSDSTIHRSLYHRFSTVPQGEYRPASKMSRTRYAISAAMLHSIQFRCQAIATADAEIEWGVCVAQILGSTTRNGQTLVLQDEDEVLLQGHGTNITLHILVCALIQSA